MSVLGEVLKSFVEQQPAQSSGITTEGNIIYEFERYSFFHPEYRIHIVVDKKIEDYDEALKRALEEEDYLKAEEIDKLINKRNDSRRETDGIDGDFDGEED